MTAAPFRLPTLPGDGVCLQPLGEHAGDGDLYAALYGCAHAMRWIGEPLGRGEARRRYAGAVQANRRVDAVRRVWVLRVPPDPAGLGLLGRDECDGLAEVGILLAAGRRRPGLASAAFRLLVDHHFAHQPRVDLVARHRVGHAAAAALMARTGFVRTTGVVATVPADLAWCRWTLTGARWQAWSSRPADGLSAHGHRPALRRRPAAAVAS